MRSTWWNASTIYWKRFFNKSQKKKKKWNLFKEHSKAYPSETVSLGRPRGPWARDSSRTAAGPTSAPPRWGSRCRWGQWGLSRSWAQRTRSWRSLRPGSRAGGNRADQKWGPWQNIYSLHVADELVFCFFLKEALGLFFFFFCLKWL